MALTEVRQVHDVMGTVVSLAAWTDSGQRARVENAVADALSWLRDVDDRFSLYKPATEWLQVMDGSRDMADAHPDIGHVWQRCQALTAVTRGAFTMTARPGRPPDPGAYVKGWATQLAADRLSAAGAVKVCVNCGGDVVVAGGDRPWRIGVQDPFAPGGLRGVVEVRRGAVATSGTYERGHHLIDPRTGGAAVDWASVTVVGPDLGMADAYSTALFAGGERDLDWFEPLVDYSAYFIRTDGSTRSLRFVLAD